MLDENHSENEFYNKNIVITGASSGIGRSASIYFLNCGANVVLAGQDKDSMLNMCNENGFKNGTIMQFDLIDDQTIFDFKTAIVESLSKIDILIISHGVLLDGDVEKSYPQDVDYSLDINLRSVYLLIKYLSPYRNEGASIRDLYYVQIVMMNLKEQIMNYQNKKGVLFMSKEINKKLTSPRLFFSVLGGCCNYFYSNILTSLQ